MILNAEFEERLPVKRWNLMRDNWQQIRGLEWIFNRIKEKR
jgi:hypothetical protein